MTKSPVRLPRGFTYVTGNNKKNHRTPQKVTDLSRGQKPMKQGTKRTFKIPVTNVTIWPRVQEKDNKKKKSWRKIAPAFFCANSRTRRRQGLTLLCTPLARSRASAEKSPNEEKRALTGFYLSAKAFPLRGLSSSPALRRLTAFVA